MPCPTLMPASVWASATTTGATWASAVPRSPPRGLEPTLGWRLLGGARNGTGMNGEPVNMTLCWMMLDALALDPKKLCPMWPGAICCDFWMTGLEI